MSFSRVSQNGIDTPRPGSGRFFTVETLRRRKTPSESNSRKFSSCNPFPFRAHDFPLAPLPEYTVQRFSILLVCLLDTPLEYQVIRQVFDPCDVSAGAAMANPWGSLRHQRNTKADLGRISLRTKSPGYELSMSSTGSIEFSHEHTCITGINIV